MNAPAEQLPNTMKDLSALAFEYQEAKHAETLAVNRRRALGDLLCQALPGVGEGVAKATMANVRVSITYGVNRTVDSDRLKAEWASLPPAAQDAFRWKADVAVPALRGLSGAALAAAQDFITVKPTAPSIKVEIL